MQLTPVQSESEVPLHRQLFEQIAAQTRSGEVRGEWLAPTRVGATRAKHAGAAGESDADIPVA
jgi:hypothetical protein